MEARLQFWDTSSPLLEDGNCYQRLLGKLIYLIALALKLCMWLVFLVNSCMNLDESTGRELQRF